jgi:ribosomal-protein-alanine acetyltransferase
MLKEDTRATVRRVTAADLDRILEIENACFGVDAYDRNTFAGYLGPNGDLFRAAWSGGKIQGYTLACVSRGRAEVISVAVAPDARRQGVARALMKSVLIALGRRKVEYVALLVRVTNRGAQALYKELGFRTVRLWRGYYDDGADGWLMHLRRSGGFGTSGRANRPATTVILD